MERILITGGCGFVGSNLALYFKVNYPHARIIVLDNLKRRGSELSLVRLRNADIEFIHGDIRNKEDFEEVGFVDVIIDAAAEPSVLAGIDNSPEYLINTNLSGTINCLNYAVKHKAKFIFLSTSRVYPFHALDEAAYYEEPKRFAYNHEQIIPGVSSKGINTAFPLKGSRSLYGATKLASELLIQEYIEFFDLKAVVNRCGVISGPWQMGKIDQGVIVLWMARHFWKQELTYNGYGGSGKQVRDILHVHDLYRLVEWQIKNMDLVNGKTLNVGGGNQCSLSLLELTTFCEKYTGNKIKITPVIENRKADLRIYYTDNEELISLTGWQPLYSCEQILEEIFCWIQLHEDKLKPILY